jgi:hypothetical protein
VPHTPLVAPQSRFWDEFSTKSAFSNLTDNASHLGDHIDTPLIS